MAEAKPDSLHAFLGEDFARRCVREERVTDYLLPQRVLWQTPGVENAQGLLKNTTYQPQVQRNDVCVLKMGDAVLLDFGVELHGGIRIIAHYPPKYVPYPLRVRVRFGESAAEAMSELGGETQAINEHSIRDGVFNIATMGSTNIGNTGFRFVRIDALDAEGVLLESVHAAFTHLDIAPKGSFSCSDPLLERIWHTGAYTVFLNMQSLLWDGIKRDRLVWVGDLHTEVSTIQAVYGDHGIVPRSLDFARDNTPLPNWMNGIPSYSMWWVLLQDTWYLHSGDKAYLRQQQDYLCALLKALCELGKTGQSIIEGHLFLDWPSSNNREGAVAGVHALHGMSLRRGAELLRILNQQALARRCDTVADALEAHAPQPNGCKQAAALQVLAGHAQAEKTNRDILRPDSTQGLSTFLGYYVLQVRAQAGDIDGCLDTIREYWGGMLKLGATTFWEHFDMAWLEGASPIDELPQPGKVEVHGHTGDFCYYRFRHSLCHGWASGPTAWMSEHILGIQPLEPGCKKVRIAPQLGSLQWAEGVYPTPCGPIEVRHEKRPDGTVDTEIKAPSGIEVVR